MRFEVYEDRSGAQRWRLRSGSRQVAASGESFSSRPSARRAAAGFKRNAHRCSYGLYLDVAGAWRWRARPSVGGRTVASSGEAFYDRSAARRAAANVKLNAGSADGP